MTTHHFIRLIHAQLYEMGPYFSINYKGSVLAIVLFATFGNGGLASLWISELDSQRRRRFYISDF